MARPCSKSAATGSALACLPLLARTSLMEACGSTVRSVWATMSAPWFVSTTMRSALQASAMSMTFRAQASGEPRSEASATTRAFLSGPRTATMMPVSEPFSVPAGSTPTTTLRRRVTTPSGRPSSTGASIGSRKSSSRVRVHSAPSASLRICA